MNNHEPALQYVACPIPAHVVRWPTDVRNWAAAELRGASTLSESPTDGERVSRS